MIRNSIYLFRHAGHLAVVLLNAQILAVQTMNANLCIVASNVKRVTCGVIAVAAAFRDLCDIKRREEAP